MKAKVLKPCVIGSVEYSAGQVAEVRDKDVEKLTAKGFIASAGAAASGEADTSNAPGASSALEPIVSRISDALGVERKDNETPVQFLERFAGNCERITQRITDEASRLEGERDEAVAHREQAVAENDKIKAELEELKAQLVASNNPSADAKSDAEKADEPKGDAKADAKSKAKS